MKQTFNLILTLVTMFTMAQTAWAATVKETRTTTWQMDGGASGSTTLANSLTLLNAEGKRLYYYNTIQDGDNSFSLSTRFGSKTTSTGGDILKNQGELQFTNLEGTITKVELKNFSLMTSGIQMYVGRDKTNTSTLLHLQGNNSDYDVPSSVDPDYDRSATFEGSIAVSQSNPLKIMFKDDGHNASLQSEFGFENGYITVTYEVEVEAPDPEDPGHTFSFNANGNTLTATCTETASYHHCSLGNSRTSTLTLTADDVPYSEQFYVASLNLGDFIDETGLAVTNGGIVYRNKSTGVESTSGEFQVGDYTVTATIIISGTSYTLTKDFKIIDGFKVNNSYSQFSTSKISALEGDEMTITFTPQMGETLDALTLTGATSGNNIAYTQSDNTYTFNMPAEDVNLNATITYPLNENDFAQSGATYTIKTAEGWNYFCQRLKVDTELNGFSGKTIELAGDITVTTMAGNYDHSFKGTFDGKGHTLTFNYTADMPNSAPFCITNGATIRSLHVTGLIQAGNYAYCGGLVGSANGSLTIENCRVSTQISSTISGTAFNGGFVGLLSSQYNQCHITGCVFDGLICNSNTWNQTYGCGGFIGAMSQYAYVDLTDCLFLHGQYDNNGNKCELLWGYDNDKNSTFFYRSNGYGEGKLTNCFYVGTRGLKQGSPAVESTDAPDNFAHFGTPTDHGFLKVYGHTMVFDGKYYTPTYGDLVETYDYRGVKSYNIEYDDAPLGIPDITSPLWTESLRYNRSFTAGKPMTVMLPFNFTRNRITLAGSNENPSGKFYEFKGIEENQDHKWVAVMIETGETLSNEVVENTLQANHPYLYVPGESTEHWVMYVSGGFSIFTEGNEGGEKETEYNYGDGMPWNHWMFKGTYQPRYWSETEHIEEVGKVYGFAGASKEVQGVYDNTITVEAGEFVRAKIGAKIRPTSCYLEWVEPQANNARALTRGAAAEDVELPQSITVKLVSASGETTSIGEIDTKTGEISLDGWYTMDGVKLSGKPTKKGLYINNGRKVVIEF
ncbi:MAG: hypothetical protein E7104_12965 [Prevotella sp.]|nr:hypothetical protein [Prevotella sp.]